MKLLLLSRMYKSCLPQTKNHGGWLTFNVLHVFLYCKSAEDCLVHPRNIPVSCS